MVIAIGEAARRSGCSVAAIRFYEDQGLLPGISRLASGRRDYGAGAIERLIFIRRCRDLYLKLNDIRSLVQLLDREHTPCEAVRDLTSVQLGAVRLCIRELRALEQTLTLLARGCSVESCGGGSAADCTIITGLSQSC